MKKQVDIFIASLPRSYHIVQTINSLINQPEVNKIFLVCNNYTDSQYNILKKEINKYKNVIIFKSDNTLGCSERFKYIYLSTSKYIGFVDDDLIYPENYLSILINACDKYKGLVSFHGRILKKKKSCNYYRHTLIMYHCMKEVVRDVEVDIIGCGVSLVERALVPEIINYYEKITDANMDDIYFSYLALEYDLKRIVLAHPLNYFKAKKIDESDNYIYTKYKNKCSAQTLFINKYFL